MGLRIDEIAYRLVSNPWFDRAVIATIVVNCVFLALVDPTKASNQQETYLMVGDYVFSGIFIAELLAKWLALSIPTYFKDKWNWVDFVVVLESLVSLVLEAVKSTSSLDISALRALRVLRPLRAITYIQQVKLLFETVISAFKVVYTLLLCVGCVMLFFGNVGYAYWADKFSNTCVSAADPHLLLDDGLVCGGGFTCPDGYECMHVEGFVLNHGVTGYYDIWHAMLQAFQAVSLDGWQQVMWHTQDAAGDTAWIYFAVIVVLGNVLLVSMFPAVISTKLEAAIEREEERKRQMRLAEQGKGRPGGKKAGKSASEFELLLNEYSKIEAEEIASIERLAAVRRGDVHEKPDGEPLPPKWTPFPRSQTLNRLRKAVLMELGPFALVVYSVIFLNALVLCLDHAHASDATNRVLSGFNEAFTGLFVVEMVIKLGVLGPHTYFTDGYNVFDFAITWLGLVEIAIQVGGFFTGLRIVRIFRIARVLRLASLGKLGRTSFNPSPQVDLARMVSIITTSVPWIVNIYVVQLLLMYTFSVLGMQFFGGYLDNVDEADNSIRFNYNSFGKAAVTILDLFTGNLWGEMMFDTIGATGEQTGIIFYVVWLLLSRWLVVAMVVTVLFYRIDVDTGEYLRIAAKNSMRSVFALEHAFMQCHKSHVFHTWKRRYEESTGNRSSTKGQIKLFEYRPPAVQPGLWRRLVASNKTLLVFEPHNPVRELCQWVTCSASALPYSVHGRHGGGIHGVNAGENSSTAGVISDETDFQGNAENRSNRGGRRSSTKGDRFSSSGSGQTRGIGGSETSRKGVGNHLTESNRIPQGRAQRGHQDRMLHQQQLREERQGCWRTFLSRRGLHRNVRCAYEAAMVCAVTVMMVVVCRDVELASGRRTSADEIAIMHVLETLAVTTLIAEAILLIIVRGLILLPDAYLRDPSSLFDFSLTFLAAICLWKFGDARWSTSSLAVSIVKALRALNVIRLMKFVRMSQGLEDVLKALLSSGNALCLAGGMTLFFWVQWSIVGLQVWEGTFSYCSDPVMAEANEVDVYHVYLTDGNGISGQTECEAAGYDWKNADWNFDNFGHALHSVLIIFSFNGWQEILFAAVNARVSSEGLNGKQWQSTWAALYFLIVLMISLVLVLLIVGVVFSMYSFINLTRRSGRRLSSLKQAFWAVYEAKLTNVQPDSVPACPRDARALRRYVFKMAVSRRWGLALASLIVANVVMRFLVGSHWLHYSEAPTWIHAQEAVFAAIFVSEWTSRAIAFGGVRAVTRSPFQIADSLSTLILAFVFVDEILFLFWGWDMVSSPFWKGVEAVSMVRLLRLGHTLPDVQELLLVTVKASGTVFPLFAVLIMLTFLWSVCGVIIFGNETYLADLFGGGSPWDAANRHQGFFGVAQGMQTMLGIATTPGSNGWISLMQGYERVTPIEWRWGVLLFFGSYALLTRFLLVNLFMMTLLFKYKTHSKDKVGMAIAQVNQFKHAWMKYAYTYTKEYRTICAGQLVSLLRELPPPLGVGTEGSYYDCKILAKKVLSVIGVDCVRSVPAHQLSEALSLPVKNSRHRTSDKSHAMGSGPGLIKLDFSKVLVAVHRIVLFGVTLEDERQLSEQRDLARNNLRMLKLGIHRFVAMKAKRPGSSTRNPVDSVAARECSLLRTQLPATFMARSSMALTAEFLRWREHVDLRGYDDKAHREGRCLLRATTNEVDATSALEQLTAKLSETHVGDRKLFSRLAEIRQHGVTLKELRAKLESVKADYIRSTWDTSSVRVRQMIDDERKGFGITSVCASMDGSWVFCTTENGQLKVFKRERKRTKKGKSRKKASHALVQSLSVRGESENSSFMGLCVTCSLDGFMVMVGCSDSTVRSFSQDLAGLRRVVHAMQAAGDRGRRPTVSYRPGSIGKGHKAAVKCVAWLEPNYFYTGGADGTVCMWRKGSIKRPAQSVDMCRSFFSHGALRCLTLWRVAYGLDLLASCVEVDESLDVEPPAYLLVGDGEGHLSILPSRTDSKFFAIDVWKPSWKQQIDSSGGAVTAVDVAWGRIYTASGESGTIKAWDAVWQDETKEKWPWLLELCDFSLNIVRDVAVAESVFRGLYVPLIGLQQVGQFAVHSAVVSVIVHTEGLMLSAGEDLSIVTWHPPTLNSGSQPSATLVATPDKDDLQKGNASPSSPFKKGSTGESDLKSPSREAGGGGRYHSTILHETDPGFVQHTAEVVGLAVLPGAVVSADLSGRILVRGPDRLIESHHVQVLPGEDAIQQARPHALEVLKARGRCNPSPTAVATPPGAGSGNGAMNGRDTPTGMTAWMPQESLDRTRILRFLLRGKSRRQIKDDVRAEKQRLADLDTARMFARRLGQEESVPLATAVRPLLLGGIQSRASESSNRSSTSEKVRASRRRSLARSVSMRTVDVADGTGVSQDTADISKIVDMDQKPAFLDTTDLDSMADHPEVYLAELMHHFFPGKDLAPPPTAAIDAVATMRAAREHAVRGAALNSDEKGKKRDSTSGNGRRGSAMARLLRLSGAPVEAAPGGAEAVEPDTAFPPSPLHVVPAISGLQSKLRQDNGSPFPPNGISERTATFPEEPALMGNARHFPLTGGGQVRGQASQGGLRPFAPGGVPDGNTACNTSGTPKANVGTLLTRARRRHSSGGEGKGDDEGSIPAEGSGANRCVVPDPTPFAADKENVGTSRSAQAGECKQSNTRMSAKPNAAGSPSLRLVEAPNNRVVRFATEPASTRPSLRWVDDEQRSASAAAGVTSTSGSHGTGDGSVFDHGIESYIGDNLSTAQERERGSIIVHIPRTPQPGVWTASVEYDETRDVAWVLTEALRMYSREHAPVVRHTGLARKPQREQRSPGRWALLQQNTLWDVSLPLEESSPVRLVLRPGEELVVLVDGFDPATAFERRFSACGTPPPHSAALISEERDDARAGTCARNRVGIATHTGTSVDAQIIEDFNLEGPSGAHKNQREMRPMALEEIMPGPPSPSSPSGPALPRLRRGVVSTAGACGIPRAAEESTLQPSLSKNGRARQDLRILSVWEDKDLRRRSTQIRPAPGTRDLHEREGGFVNERSPEREGFDNFSCDENLDRFGHECGDSGAILGYENEDSDSDISDDDTLTADDGEHEECSSGDGLSLQGPFHKGALPRTAACHHYAPSDPRDEGISSSSMTGQLAARDETNSGNCRDNRDGGSGFGDRGSRTRGASDTRSPPRSRLMTMFSAWGES